MENDVLIFRSSAFSLDPPRDHRGILPDCPLGDDIAAFFASELPKRFPQWTCGTPVLEDSWSSLDCMRDDRTFAMVVSYFPTEGTGDQWVVQFGSASGLLWFLRRKRPELLAELIDCVSVIVSDHPNYFVDSRWLSELQFLDL